MINTESIYHTMKSRFGYDSFRPHQLEIIRHVLDGGDALVIMPTGGGKSICYQLPPLLKEGFTLVISPLISLMNDQVRSLKANGIVAGALHSGTSTEESREIYQQISQGLLKILYVSPERALSTWFLDYITTQLVTLIAIDEVHCVSIWGNDFRPEYAQLRQLTSLFPLVPVLALTATADKATQVDIQQQLQLRESKVFLSSFERPNIHLSARAAIERLDEILDFLRHHSGQPGIIYCLARKTTEKVADALTRKGYKASAYHAELNNNLRKKIQDDFQFNRIQIVCATIAFGMGIDKPDIRWIIHYNLPKNIENYYQEIGRSGRDGQPAEAMMFYSFYDIKVYRDFIVKSEANDTFKRVQNEKLDRIWEYSQAMNCRTNVILNYFGEYRDTPCGHCDHCTNPPQGFDGTRHAQIALSACKRSGESIGINLLVDVIRGSGKREIYDRNLHQIKTYGAGKEISYRDWMQYITQLINQGLLEIDYTQHSILKCTPLSNAVLFENRSVILHRQAAAPIEPVELKKSKSTRFSEALLDRLEELTMQISQEETTAPFAIFPKPTIREMANHRPFTMEEFSALRGIGDYKARKYGQRYLDAIRDFMREQNFVKKPRGATYVETLNLFQQGLSLEDIATTRNITVATVCSHLARLYEKGEAIDLHALIRQSDLTLAQQAWRASGYSDQIGRIKEQVGDSLDYGKLNLAMAILRKEKETTPS
ncbi:MAG TPA: DNA helicase RecQ [Saprospiraceae bacterium]|nr:DNA helicase RecQ [Saprospiraceae bacterium]